MPAVILTVTSLAKAFGADHVLRDVSFTLAEDERMGLVGVNGSGKSTLLRLIQGQLAPDEGQISLQKGLRVGYLAQNYHPQPGATVLEEAKAVLADVFGMESRMRQLEQAMTGVQGRELDRLQNEYGRLSECFEHADGYQAHSRIQGVLSGLGFERPQQAQAADSLSGGELTRLGLAKLLLQHPDVLLLDEPTNHLDLQALAWLETFLQEYSGAVLVISHDRYFLDHVCTSMGELLFGVLEKYDGNYTRYLEQRTQRFESRLNAYRLQQKEIRRQQGIIARFRSFNREKSIRAAESRQKALDRIQRLEHPDEERQIGFRFVAGSRLGKAALKVRGLQMGYGAEPVFSQVSFELKGGDRAALIGANGIGKSTLVECLTGKLMPQAGQYVFGEGARIGYFDQKHRLLHEQKTVLDEVWDDFPRLEQHQVRSALGLFLFSGDDVFDLVGTLSGGERSRVALTKLMLARDNFLILDEPTNHLDADSREVLEDALNEFEGTILAVSHDRYFINRFANKILVLTRDGVQMYPGNYDDYLRQTQGPLAVENEAAAGLTKTQLVQQRRRQKAEQQQEEALLQSWQQAEQQVDRLEEQLRQTEDSLADPQVYSDPQRAAQAGRACQALREELQQAYAAWERADSALHGANQES